MTSTFSSNVYARTRTCFDGSPFRSTVRLVALVIASYMGRKPDGRYRCHPPVRTIAKRAGLDHNTVARIVKNDLCVGNDPIFELVIGNWKPGKKGHSNIYTIPKRYVDAYYGRYRASSTTPTAPQPASTAVRLERLQAADSDGYGTDDNPF